MDVRLLVSDYILFGVYQDWVHQSPGNHLDGGITEYGKCQARWKNYLYAKPKLRLTVWKSLENIFRNFFCGARRYTSSEVELGEGDHFSVSYLATSTRL